MPKGDGPEPLQPVPKSPIRSSLKKKGKGQDIKRSISLSVVINEATNDVCAFDVLSPPAWVKRAGFFENASQPSSPLIHSSSSYSKSQQQQPVDEEDVFSRQTTAEALRVLSQPATMSVTAERALQKLRLVAGHHQPSKKEDTDNHFDFSVAVGGGDDAEPAAAAAAASGMLWRERRRSRSADANP